MARIDFDNPEPEVRPQTPVVTLSEPAYKHSIVDSEHQPFSALLTHIEGISWTTNYYSRILSENEELQTYDPNQLAIYQQWHLVNNYVMKLQGSLSTSPDNETNEMTVTGTAYLFPYMRPNVGDFFIADIGDGRAGQFTVTEVTRKTILKESCFEITFILAREVKNKRDEGLMDYKVVKESYFVQDFMTYGQNPILIESDYFKLKNANRLFLDSLDDYIAEFHSRTFNTLLVPGFAVPTYDPFAVKALFQIVERDMNTRIQTIKEVNVDELKEYYRSSIWYVLINAERGYYHQVWRNANPVGKTAFNINPHFESFRYSGISQCVKPVDSVNNVDHYYGFASRPQVGNTGVGSSGTIMAGETGRTTSKCCRLNYYHGHHHRMYPWDPKNHLAHLSDWVCCGCDSCSDDSSGNGDDVPGLGGYVVSLGLWNGKPLDEFEQIVLAHLNRETVDPIRIINLLTARHTWTPEVRYYRVLALLIILKTMIRRM